MALSSSYSPMFLPVAALAPLLLARPVTLRLPMPGDTLRPVPTMPAAPLDRELSHEIMAITPRRLRPPKHERSVQPGAVGAAATGYSFLLDEGTLEVQTVAFLPMTVD